MVYNDNKPSLPLTFTWTNFTFCQEDLRFETTTMGNFCYCERHCKSEDIFSVSNDELFNLGRAGQKRRTACVYSLGYS